MVNITTTFEGNLLTITVIGNLSTIDLLDVVNTCYASGKIKDVIWDLTDGSLQSIPIEEFEAIANAAKFAALVGTRKGGKTAFVGNTVSEYNIIRFYTVIAELSGVPVEYQVFRSIEGAKCWIGKKTPGAQ